MREEYRIVRWGEPASPHTKDLLERMTREGYAVFQWTDPPGTVYGAHEHSADQSHWIISGHLALEVDGYGNVELRPGDRDFMPAGTGHSARVIGDEPVTYLIGELLSE